MKSSSRVISQPDQIRYVFLDRDGVINRKLPEGQYVTHWGEFELLPGVESAVVALNRTGRTVIVISNQRGIALGIYTTEQLERLHSQLQDHLMAHGARIDGFYYCPHDEGQCTCRKPNTGLLEQALRDFPSASPDRSILIGDSLSDIQAARSMGIRSIFIDSRRENQKAGAEKAFELADAVSPSLWEAVSTLLS
jgi:D-glycero-D-manno-heptose 1,7-bisphosphate phosphatase